MKKKISLTEDEFHEYSDEYAGICLDCGEIQMDGVEPDAENYECESCGKKSVCGMSMALIMGEIDLAD